MKSLCGFYKVKRNTVRRYTPEEKRFIENNVSGRSHAELTDMFNRKFNCSKTSRQIMDFLTYNKLKNGGLSNSTKPIGSEYVDCSGRWLIKTGQPDVWKSKHIVIWEAANGPVPKGHFILFADGDRSNFDLDNLLLVSRPEMSIMTRHKLIFPDREATRTGKLIADLILQINRKKREAKEVGAAKTTKEETP
jgi:hypothetical protein